MSKVLSKEDREFNRWKVAALAMAGHNAKQISEELDISWNTVTRLLKEESTQTLIRESCESAISKSKQMIQFQMEKLTPLAIKAITDALSDPEMKIRLDAASKVFKMAGMMTEHKEMQDQGTGTIQVILPGVTVEKEVINVTPGS